jgi:hypothetical protein
MSIELDDIASAFAELQKRTDKLSDRATRLAIDNAIDALLMGIGAIELRLNALEEWRSTAGGDTLSANPAFDGLPKLLKN